MRIYEKTESQRKTIIQEYLQEIDEIKETYKFLLVDSETAEIVYQTSSAYGIPSCFFRLIIKKVHIDYFEREIAIEI